MAAWNATRPSILEQPRPVEVLHGRGAGVPAGYSRPAAMPAVGGRTSTYSTGIGETYLHWRDQHEVRRAVRQP